VAAVRTQGPSALLSDQRIVIAGAGSAGMGVAASLAEAMVSREGLSFEAAAARIWVMDKDGLIGPSRPASSLSASQAPFARKADRTGGDPACGSSLLQVVASVKPTVLLGFTGVGGAFKEEVIKEMARHVARPIIFPLSNPTANAECSAEQAYAWTAGSAVFGGGSPFDAVTLPSGASIEPSQINNMFMFPGMGLCAVAVQPRRITNAMFQAAAYAMASMVTKEDLAVGRVVPRVRDIRAVSAAVATAAAQTAIGEGIVQRMPPAGNLNAFMKGLMYIPRYQPIINDVY
jgi:malate dehydrogenase (oxaloacetate-decarboxylating)(NADP+)